MQSRLQRFVQASGLAALGLLALHRPAEAVPSFAAQTGQPCTACHIGAFGPQLTPYGRAFKIGGYTQSGGDGLAAHIPLSAFIQSSFTNTGSGQPGGAAPHYAANNNPALDQASFFLAGRFTDYAGAFIQTTYDGIGRSAFIDNSDIRLTTPLDIGDTNMRIGLSLNNGPTVQDPFNSSMVWGPPYEGSALSPTPSWEPVLMGALQGTVIGLTAYGWYDNALYAEFGAYRSMDNNLAKTFGTYGAPATTADFAPYARLAYEWDWGGQAFHIGAIGLHAELQPGSLVGVGTDKYNDVALDSSYEWLGDGTHVFSVIGSWTHEMQRLDASYSQGLSANLNNTLDEFRANVTYFYQNTYGGSLGVKKIWGSADSIAYAPGPISGSRTGKPDSTGFIAEADWVPFGKDGSFGQPFANVKLGLQYTYYPQFNGASSNYDGSGRSATGNNTLYAFAWFAF